MLRKLSSLKTSWVRLLFQLAALKDGESHQLLSSFQFTKAFDQDVSDSGLSAGTQTYD